MEHDYFGIYIYIYFTVVNIVRGCYFVKKNVTSIRIPITPRNFQYTPSFKVILRLTLYGMIVFTDNRQIVL